MPSLVCIIIIIISIIIAHMLTAAVGTAFLWWSYVDIKNDMDKLEDIDVPLLDVDVNNEQAFFWSAIVCTVLTVSDVTHARTHALAW